MKLRKLRLSTNREPFSRVAHEEYMPQLTHRSYRINELTKEEVVELLDMRRVLETYCIEEAIRQITPHGIKALEANVKALRRAISAKQPLGHRYFVSKDFHLIVAEIAGNSAVYQVLENTCEKLVGKKPLDGFWHEGFSALRQHKAILRTIKNQDIKNAQELLKSHLEEIKYTVLKQMAVRKREA